MSANPSATKEAISPCNPSSATKEAISPCNVDPSSGLPVGGPTIYQELFLRRHHLWQDNLSQGQADRIIGEFLTQKQAERRSAIAAQLSSSSYQPSGLSGITTAARWPVELSS